jgi:dihydrofolate synthase/folylpolyglutamate synthase
MLASVLRRAGYRTGLFTSPHLSQVEERIVVDGEPISAAELTALLAQIEAAIADPFVEPHRAACGSASTILPPKGGTTNLEPTFFEIATALGFLHFVHRRVDVAVVEVGLGGRFDSTNVCSPILSIITSISLDHTRQLGDRLESIAREKAGIVKPGRPVVSGAVAPQARQVIESVCATTGSTLLQIGRDFDFHYEPGKISNDGDVRARFRMVWGSGEQHGAYELGLLGEHQAANAAVTVAALTVLRKLGWSISEDAVAAGLATVSWPARMEVVGRRPLVVLDCAHNVASARALVDTLGRSFPATRRLLVFACSTDKDLPGILRVLAPHFERFYLTRFDSPRAAEPAQLAVLLPPATLATVHHTASDALAAAQADARPEDIVCITGSVFLAGELRPIAVSPTR